MTNWEKEAKQLLKVELARQDVTYIELAAKLKEMGVSETKGAIASKLFRGTYSMVFFMQCMKAIGVETLNLAVHATE